MKRSSIRFGFTLLELLVVISIIGLLASVILASTNESRKKARDARRLEDLNVIRNALELFYSANGRYPFTDEPTNTRRAGLIGTCQTWTDANCLVDSDTGVGELAPHLSGIPRDPLDTGAQGAPTYFYHRNFSCNKPSGPTEYYTVVLATQMENSDNRNFLDFCSSTSISGWFHWADAGNTDEEKTYMIILAPGS